jgi:DnaJ domain
MSGPAGADPFSALGLPARAGLTNDDVRAAWRRLAAATHPDRADGGDPARFAQAAAAYTALRTRSGRGEALADLAEGAHSPSRRGARAGAAGRPARRAPGPTSARSPTDWRAAALAARPPGLAGARLLHRVRRGRPARLILRVLIAAAVSAGAVVVAGLQPATPALWAGAATWLLRTARHDLAPPG